MEFHNWIKIDGVDRSNMTLGCVSCGIVSAPGALESVMSSRCPPWFSTGYRENTNANRECGTEWTLIMRARIDQLKDLTRVAEEEGVNVIPVASIQMAIIGLEQLIQKHENLK